MKEQRKDYQYEVIFCPQADLRNNLQDSRYEGFKPVSMAFAAANNLPGTNPIPEKYGLRHLGTPLR
jgi:hypothetical protein